MIYEIGKSYPEFAGKTDLLRISWDAGGLLLSISNINVSPAEIEQYQAKVPFEMRYVVLKDVVYLLFRYGKLQWQDAPYYPFEVPPMEEITQGNGIAFTTMLFEANNGTLLATRLLALSTKFSTEIYASVQKAAESRLNYDEYMKRVNNTYALFPTKELLERAQSRFVLR